MFHSTKSELVGFLLKQNFLLGQKLSQVAFEYLPLLYFPVLSLQWGRLNLPPLLCWNRINWSAETWGPHNLKKKIYFLKILIPFLWPAQNIWTLKPETLKVLPLYNSEFKKRSYPWYDHHDGWCCEMWNFTEDLCAVTSSSSPSPGCCSLWPELPKFVQELLWLFLSLKAGPF